MLNYHKYFCPTCETTKTIKENTNLAVDPSLEIPHEMSCGWRGCIDNAILLQMRKTDIPGGINEDRRRAQKEDE